MQYVIREIDFSGNLDLGTTVEDKNWEKIGDAFMFRGEFVPWFLQVSELCQKTMMAHVMKSPKVRKDCLLGLVRAMPRRSNEILVQIGSELTRIRAGKLAKVAVADVLTRIGFIGSVDSFIVNKYDVNIIKMIHGINRIDWGKEPTLDEYLSRRGNIWSLIAKEYEFSPYEAIDGDCVARVPDRDGECIIHKRHALSKEVIESNDSIVIDRINTDVHTGSYRCARGTMNIDSSRFTNSLFEDLDIKGCALGRGFKMHENIKYPGIRGIFINCLFIRCKLGKGFIYIGCRFGTCTIEPGSVYHPRSITTFLDCNPDRSIRAEITGDISMDNITVTRFGPERYINVPDEIRVCPEFLSGFPLRRTLPSGTDVILRDYINLRDAFKLMNSM